MGKLREIDNVEGLGVDGRIILKWIAKKLCVRAWTEIIWLRIAISNELLIINCLMDSGFDKMSGTA